MKRPKSCMVGLQVLVCVVPIVDTGLFNLPNEKKNVTKCGGEILIITVPVPLWAFACRR